MKVLRAEAIDFGQLSGESLEFGPGLNVICGLNEAGKSTWIAALYAGICGRRRSRGAGRLAEREFAAAHRPWNGNSWGVRIVLQLDDGRTVEIEQNLDDPERSRVTDLATGRSITEEFRFEGSPDASRKLGLSRESMLASATVRQAEMHRVRDEADALQSALQAAATAAGTDETAEAALGRLEAFFREQVGLRRANSTRPLQISLGAEAAAREALAEAEAARAGYFDLRERRDAAADRCARRERELRRAEAWRDRHALAEAQAALERARRLQDRLPEGEAPDLQVMDREIERIEQALTRYEERPALTELPDGPSAVALREMLEALPEMPTGDLEVNDLVADAHGRWKASGSEIEAHAMHRPEEPIDTVPSKIAPSDLREWAAALAAPPPMSDEHIQDELEDLYRKLRIPLWKLGARAVGGVLFILAVTLLWMGFEQTVCMGVAAAAAAALAAGFLPQPERTEIERHIGRLEASLAVEEAESRRIEAQRLQAGQRVRLMELPAEPQRLRELAEEAESAASVRELLEQWEERNLSLQASLESAEQRLLRALEDRVAMSDEDDAGPGALYQRYRLECRERAALARKAHQHESLKARLGARAALESAAAASNRRRAEIDASILELGEELGLTEQYGRRPGDLPGSPEVVIAALRERRQESAAEFSRWNAAREDRVALETLLAGGSLQDLEARAALLESSVDGLDGTEEPMDLGPDPEARIESLRRAHAEARDELQRLTGQIQNQERNLVSVGEAEEALERARSELARIERLERTLGTTQEFLEEARRQVQHDIAPRLAAVLERHLPRITGWRYADPRVDPETLEVTVRTAEGEWRGADELSHGTMEQIYLLLRVALVRLLGETGEAAPIFLDDPTVQSDSVRTEAILETLEAISAEHQILVFSQEEEVRRWAEGRQADGSARLIDLPPVGESAD